MRAHFRIAWSIAGILVAYATALTLFPSQSVHAKEKSLKDSLEHALVGQVVTSKVLLGDKARPKGVPYDVSVRTLVDAETGEIAYRAEDLLVLAAVKPGEMQHYFDPGESFRITRIRIKGDRIEIQLKELSGGATEVKLLLGEGWQSQYDIASVQATVQKVFRFEQDGQQQMVAEQAPTPAAPVEAAAQTITPAAVELSTNQATVSPISAAPPDQSGLTSRISTGPAYVDCGTLKQLELYSTPQASLLPAAVLQCGEKVMALGEQNGWVKVRTELNVEGYLSRYFLSYDKRPPPEQPLVEQPTSPNEQPPAPDENVQQSPAPQTTEQSPSAYAPPAEPAKGEGDSWSWYQYLSAGLFVLAAVALAIGLAKASEGRRQAAETSRRNERLATEATKKESAEKREKEERRRRDHEAHERAAANRKYGDVVAQFKELVATAGSQVEEIWHAGMALSGKDFEAKTAAEFIFVEVVGILSVVSKLKGEIPNELERLCQAIHDGLEVGTEISVMECNTLINSLRVKNYSAHLPYIVQMLDTYDREQQTQLAANAARVYCAFVLAACQAMGPMLGVATKMVQAKYQELLRPYLSGTESDGKGSEWPTRSDSSGLRDCGECPKFYQVLRVSPTASREEVKTAFRSLAKIYHSDHHHGREDGVRRTADDLFMDLKEAYDHVSSHWSP